MEEALTMHHQACLFVSKTCTGNLVMDVNVAERGYNVAGLYSPIVISRHYVENRLQSLRVDSYAGGTVPQLSGHSGTRSHRGSMAVLPATNGPKTLCFTEQSHYTVALYRAGNHKAIRGQERETAQGVRQCMSAEAFNGIKMMFRGNIDSCF